MITEISGDSFLNRNERRQYIQLGLAQIRTHLSQRETIETYCPGPLPGFLRSKLTHCISPLRLYTDCLVNEVIAATCPQALRVLDIGCGKGDYSDFFERAGCKGLYLGLDVANNDFWQFYLRLTLSSLRRVFIQAEAEKLALNRNCINFVISSCALEHFANDQLAIKSLSHTMQPGAYGLHFIPSIWSLFLYVYHGYRRYSPVTLLKLFEEADFEVVKLWALGGFPSFLLHFIWITWFEAGLLGEVLTLGNNPPGLQRMIGKMTVGPRVRQGRYFAAAYNGLLKVCLKLDRHLPFLPSGYAILVKKRA